MTCSRYTLSLHDALPISLLFEIGEEIAIRIETDGTTSDVTARVRAHVGTGDSLVTELEILATTR